MALAGRYRRWTRKRAPAHVITSIGGLLRIPTIVCFTRTVLSRFQTRIRQFRDGFMVAMLALHLYLLFLSNRSVVTRRICPPTCSEMGS